MAGKVLFRGGKHPSRDCIGEAQGENEERNDKRTVEKMFVSIAGMLVRQVDFDDRRYLVSAILEARTSVSTSYESVRRKDIEAQLLAMRRLDDDALDDALRSCDHWTFEAIQAASTAIISEILWRDSFFVGSDGDSHRIPSDIEVQPGQPVFLPLGYDGLRHAIDAALARVATDKNRRGAIEKTHQAVLAKECIRLWRIYGDPDRQKAWRTSGTGDEGPVVSFARVVFAAAKMPLSSSRLVELLQVIGQQK